VTESRPMKVIRTSTLLSRVREAYAYVQFVRQVRLTQQELQKARVPRHSLAWLRLSDRRRSTQST
jgi:hypothetical protein